jgi:hypothetical protein
LRAQASVNAIQAMFTQTHRLDTLLQHDLLGLLSKALISQPPPMRLRPGRPASRIDPLVTQQKRTQLLARRSQRPHRRQTGTDQVAHRFVRRIRHPDRGQQPAPVQDR